VKPFSLSRVFRFRTKDGIPQISDFPDDPPEGMTDLEIRMKHFTEIENFSFLGYTLAHELEWSAPGFPVRTVQDLEVPDKEFQARVNEAKQENFTNEELGDTILDMGINWEHFVATFNTSMIAGNPLLISDVVIQRKIDSLDLITEALVREVNLRATEAHAKK
jgi:hypothetical protein